MEVLVGKQTFYAKDIFSRIENNFEQISSQDIKLLNNAAQAICRGVTSRLKVGVDIESLAADAVQDGLIAISSGGKDFGKLVTSRIYLAVKGEQAFVRPEDYDSEISFDQFVTSLRPDLSFDMRDQIERSTTNDMCIAGGTSELEEIGKKKDKQNEEYAHQLKSLIGSVAQLFDDFVKSPFIHDFLKRRYIYGETLAEVSRSIHNIRKAKQGIGYKRAKTIETGLLDRLSLTTSLSAKELLAIFSHCRSAMTILRRLEWSLDSSSNEELYKSIPRARSKRQAINFLCSLPKSLLDSFHMNLPKMSFRRAEELRAIALPEMLQTLKSQSLLSNSCFSLLRPYQKNKLEQLILTFIHQKDLTKHKLIADIAPPAAGKTFMMACLAKLAHLQGITSVFVTHSNTVLYGSDGALGTFQRVLGKDSVGIANVDYQDLGRTVTLTTYKSISSPHILERICSESRPFLFLFDEGDLSQTEIRQEAIRTLSESLDFPLLATFSATKEVAGRNLSDRAYLSHEMPLKDLIRGGFAKHILGFYVQVPIQARSGVISYRSHELHFSHLKKEEQKRLIDIPIEIYSKYHKGQQALIHCSSIQQSERTAARLRAMGIKVASLTSGNAKQNKNGALQNQYISKNIQVLISCQMLDRGFSEHGVTDVEIYATISTSKTKVYQSVTRGIRPRADRRVLIVYQMIPQGASWRSINPVLLEDVLDSDWQTPISNISQINTPEKIVHSLEHSLESSEQAFKFINCIGQHHISLKAAKQNDSSINEEIRIVKRAEIVWALDTRQLQKVERGAASVDGRRTRPVKIRFEWNDIRELALKFQKISKINLCQFTTKSPQQTLSVIWKGKHISWRSFYASVASLLFNERQQKEHRKYYSDAVQIIEEACSNSGITLLDAKEKFLKLKSEKDTKHLRLNCRFGLMEDRLFEIIGAFIKDYKLVPANITYGSVLPNDTVKLRLDAKDISISWGFLISSGIRSLLPGLSQKDSMRCLGLATNLLFNWYTTGVKPSIKEANNIISKHISSLNRRKELEELIPLNVPQIVDLFFKHFGISSEQEVNYSYPNPESTLEWTYKKIKYEIRWEWFYQKVFRYIVPGISQTDSARAPQACLDMTLSWWKQGFAPTKEIGMQAWTLRVENKNQEDYVDRLLLLTPHQIINPFLLQQHLRIDDVSTTMPERRTVAQIQVGPGIKFTLTWEGLIKKPFNNALSSLDVELAGLPTIGMRIALAKLCYNKERMATIEELDNIIKATQNL